MISPTPEVIDLASHRAYPVSKQHGRVINPYNEGKQEAFVAGAEWLKKWQEEHIWHPDSVIPPCGKYILVSLIRFNGRERTFIILSDDAEQLQPPYLWAFIEDVLPNKAAELWSTKNILQG